MATLEIKLVTVQGRASTGSTMPVPDSQPLDEQTLTVTSSSAQSNLTVANPTPGEFWMIKAVGAAIRVKVGANPTAIANSGGWHLSDGERLSLAVKEVGEKLAAILAS